MRRRYYTLAGDCFDRDTLTNDEVETIDAITKADEEAGSDATYLNRARKLVRENLSTLGELNRALSGPVGSIYRDLWYRRQMKSSGRDSPDSKRLLAAIQAHPARLIHDAFLDSGLSETDFARQLGIPRFAMSKLVSLFSSHGPGTSDNCQPEEPVSVTTLAAALARLGAGFRFRYLDNASAVGTQNSLAVPMTSREGFLLRALINGVSDIQKNGEPFPLVSDLFNLFPTADIQFIDSVVKSLLRALRRGPWTTEKYGHFEISALLPLRQPQDEHGKLLFNRWKDTDWAGEAVVTGLKQSPDTDAPSHPPRRNFGFNNYHAERQTVEKSSPDANSVRPFTARAR